MSRATFLVLWFITTAVFTGWVDNHRHLVRTVDIDCANDPKWARHSESLACTENDKREVIRTNKEK